MQNLADFVILVESLKQEIELLKQEIQLLKNGRNSSLSSTPSSQDFGKTKAISLREKSSRPSGGQKGHQGSTLEMKEIPDDIVEYLPKSCCQCGQDLSSEPTWISSRKQEIIIPPIVPKYIEHRAIACTCRNCGIQVQGQLPTRLKANIQYHPEVSALVGYLSVRQYLPYNRIAETMKDVFNLPISQGTVDNMLGNLTQKATPIYDLYFKRLQF